MKKNMGNFDRVLRSIIAITLVALNAKGIISGAPATIALIIAVVSMLTSLFGFCPLYILLGYSSRRSGWEK